MASLNSPVSPFASLLLRSCRWLPWDVSSGLQLEYQMLSLPTSPCDHVVFLCTVSLKATSSMADYTPHSLLSLSQALRFQEFVEVSPLWPRPANRSALLPWSSVDHEDSASTLTQERELRTSSMLHILNAPSPWRGADVLFRWRTLLLEIQWWGQKGSCSQVSSPSLIL